MGSIIKLSKEDFKSERKLDEEVMVADPIYDNELFKNRRRMWRLEAKKKNYKIRKVNKYKS